jgi:hypothetical protein
VGKLEGPSEFKNASGSSFHRSQNLKSLVFPVEMPTQNGRDDDDEESVGEVGNSRKPLFQTTLELTARIYC